MRSTIDSSDMLKDTDTETQDLPYYTAVRWLSCDKLLSRVFELKKGNRGLPGK